MEDLAAWQQSGQRAATGPWSAPSEPPVRPIDQSALSLPSAPAQPSTREPVSAPVPYFDAMTDRPQRRTTKERRRRGGGLVVLLFFAGLVAAGVVYGPRLYDDYVADDATPVEPDAPRSFPIATAGAADVRTATFELANVGTSDAIYTITVDFETWVSRVAIDRPDGVPDLEVLTFSDDALVRRLDASTWFQLDRGAFPFDEQLQRTDWIREIDELLPIERRRDVEIVASTEADVGGVPTRHLVIEVVPDALAAPPTPADVMDPVGDIANAVEEPLAEQAPPATAPTRPDSIETGSGEETVTLELWIDGDGLIRRSAGGHAVGLLDATILETSDDAWVPEYPAITQVMPMTAGALIELGL